ncbi:MAG: hypothetical protein QOE70_5032 [Chthoniobacter sp.]|jgi:hypothetical protein|nr:hypothetical protein [Chthoniobacter sp.]
MTKHPSKLWLLGPPAVILLTIFAYYAKYSWAREWVDDRFPWIADNIGSHLPALVVDLRGKDPNARLYGTTPAPARIPVRVPVKVPVEPPPVPPPAFVPPTFVGPDGTVDVPKLAADRAAWPKTVALKKAMEFPAVVNGKVVGKVAVPPGTEANLVSIQEGKLGLEYQGGGGWIAVEETDLAQRLQH